MCYMKDRKLKHRFVGGGSQKMNEKETVRLIEKEIDSYIEKKKLYSGIKLKADYDSQLDEKTVNEMLNSPNPDESFDRKVEKLYEKESIEMLDYVYQKMRETIVTEETREIWEVYDNHFRKSFNRFAFCWPPFEHYENQYYNCSIIVDTGYSGKAFRLLCRIALGDLLGMADIWETRGKTSFYIQVSKNTKCGFFDNQNDFGSKFKFRLEKGIQIPMDKIFKIQIEKADECTPEDVYGFDDKAYTEADVKFFFR